MTEGDIDEVAAIEYECFSLPWSRTTFQMDLSKSYIRYILAIENDSGKVVGYAGCSMMWSEGEILKVAVLPEYRKRHVGKFLLRSLMGGMKSEGISSLTLEVRRSNESAIRLYEGEGFFIVGERPGYYSSPKEDAIVMWKTDLNEA